MRWQKTRIFCFRWLHFFEAKIQQITMACRVECWKHGAVTPTTCKTLYADSYNCSWGLKIPHINESINEENKTNMVVYFVPLTKLRKISIKNLAGIFFYFMRERFKQIYRVKIFFNSTFAFMFDWFNMPTRRFAILIKFRY